MARNRNRLAEEKSPYLLQHAHNPVDWYPWGVEALRRAEEENKPILVSIGYSTCHWCHVMEKESFMDPAVAELMNRHYICIKVDREERPDVDALYMTAVNVISGSGGWPLNVFLTPDRKPFYGGTYFPPRSRPGMVSWRKLLGFIADAWGDPEKKDKILSSAEELTAVLKAHLSSSDAGDRLDFSLPDRARDAAVSGYDPRFGGFSPAPKFPMPSLLQFLLEESAGHGAGGDREVLEKVEHTLRAMAAGGIYDHVGGGFHRYATDPEWHLPHFEKMLYDNAQLVAVYVDAWRLTGDERYAAVARDTADYVCRDLRHPEGGFFSAEDADSPVSGDPEGGNVEGAFYVWTMTEMYRELGRTDGEVFAYHFGVKPEGNVRFDPHGEFAGKNVLRRMRTVEETSGRFGRKPADVRDILSGSRERLLEVRNRRPRPHLDDKVLTGWNGLMIGALARLHEQGGQERYLRAAETAAVFIRSHLYDETERRLFRRWREGDRKVQGMCEDYAFLTSGLLDLYEAGFDPQWLDWAVGLTENLLEIFHDPSGHGFFTSPADAAGVLPFRIKEETDGAVPGAASVALLNLFRLSRLTDRRVFAETARRSVQASASRLQRHPAAAPFVMSALRQLQNPPAHVIIAGNRSSESADALLRQVRTFFGPRPSLMRIADAGARASLAKHLPFVENIDWDASPARAYLCRQGACREPTTEADRLTAQLREIQDPKAS
ncbi:MAG: thioredoxin domain-containing protein [Desulfobacteraceae bacterium]|nr:thioredoxin domain-containing protein [Desulfobacteraceae bacterium]